MTLLEQLQQLAPLAAESERLIKQLLERWAITPAEQDRVLQGLSKINHETGKKPLTRCKNGSPPALCQNCLLSCKVAA